MGTVLAIASVIVALIAAGFIIYLAKELTSRETLPDGPEESDRDEDSA